MHDFQQDTRFLLCASLVSRSWSPPAQMLLFQHVAIRSQATFTALCSAITSHATHGKDFTRHVRSLSAVLDPEQPGCLQPISLSHAVSLFPNLKELDLACYSSTKPNALYLRDGKPVSILDDEALSTLRSGPPITALRLANWSSDTSLLCKLLVLYHSSLRALSLRGALISFPVLTASPLATPHHPLDLTLQSPLAPNLLDWLTNRTVRPRVRTLEFTRQPERAALASLLAAHGNELRALALPTLTTADAAHVAAYCYPRLESLRTEHPYATLPAAHVHLRHVALATGPALSLFCEKMRSGAGIRGRLERVSVMLWRGNEEELEAVRVLELLCAQRGVQIDFERDVKAFRARFWAAGVVQRA